MAKSQRVAARRLDQVERREHERDQIRVVALLAVSKAVASAPRGVDEERQKLRVEAPRTMDGHRVRVLRTLEDDRDRRGRQREPVTHLVRLDRKRQARGEARRLVGKSIGKLDVLNGGNVHGGILPYVLRLALIGAGRMGRSHLAALAGSPTVTVTAIVDPIGAADLEVPVYPDIATLCKAGGFDAALVAAPTRFHVTVVRELAAAGIPTLCEKPCGLVPDDARAIRDAVAAGGIAFRVGYWRRHVPELQALATRIAAGELGQIQLVVCYHWDVEPPPAAFRDPRSSGGILVDVAVHELDMMAWLTGSAVTSMTYEPGGVSWHPPVEGDPENAAALVRLASGCLGLVTMGRRWPDGDHQRVEVVGTDGVVTLPFGVGPAGDARIRAALRAQAEDFARLVAGGSSVSATIDDALAALTATAH